jgi:uncharacterized repeat protein (TIGR01451 family)
VVTEGSNVSYSWDFGDGQGGLGADASHAYTEPGVYTATVTASNGVGSAVAVTEVTVLIRDLAIAQTAVMTQLIPGGPFSITVVVTNSGDYPALSVVVSDTLPAELLLEAVSANVPLTLLAGQESAWEISQLLPGETAEIQLTGVVTYPLAVPLVVVNGVEVSASTPDDRPLNNSAGLALSLGDEPITALTVAAPLSPDGGGVGYLNATTTFATQINSGSNVFYTWDYGNGLTETIPPLQPGLLVYTSTAGSVYTVTDSFTATVVASNTVSVMTATVTVQIFAGDLAIEHTSETAVLRPGDWVTYTLVYQNNGDLPVTDIRLHNFYPPELLNTQVTASGAITQSTDAPYVYFLPPLAVGESGVLTVTGQASPAITTTT